MDKDKIIDSTWERWQEYLEMYPGDEWALVAQAIAHRLQQQIEETEFYKRLSHARTDK